MKLFIEPNDVLMFRDGKPFSGGDDHFARGIFPPSPATIYGALRSHILSNKWSEFNKYATEQGEIPEDVKREIGTPDGLGSLSLCQFILAKRNGHGVEQIFPMPKDVVKEKGDEKGKISVLSPLSLSDSKIITDLSKKLNNLWCFTEKPMETVGGYLSSKEISTYLSGKPPASWTKPDELFKTEERTGIRKGRITRSVETGALYSVEYFRLSENTGFTVEVGNTTLLSESGILRLGGDNRSARYSRASWDEIPVEQIKKKIAESMRFKLVLTTPAIFKNGWLPDGINPETMEGQIKGIEIKMTGACTGKPVGVGGFDFVKRKPKVMKKAVLAGSVYYFELKENNIDKVFEQIWLKPVSDERAQEGFGISFIGGY